MPFGRGAVFCTFGILFLCFATLSIPVGRLFPYAFCPFPSLGGCKSIIFKNHQHKDMPQGTLFQPKFLFLLPAFYSFHLRQHLIS